MPLPGLSRPETFTPTAPRNGRNLDFFSRTRCSLANDCPGTRSREIRVFSKLGDALSDRPLRGVGTVGCSEALSERSGSSGVGAGGSGYGGAVGKNALATARSRRVVRLSTSPQLLRGKPEKNRSHNFIAFPISSKVLLNFTFFHRLLVCWVKKGETAACRYYFSLLRRSFLTIPFLYY